MTIFDGYDFIDFFRKSIFKHLEVKYGSIGQCLINISYQDLI